MLELKWHWAAGVEKNMFFFNKSIELWDKTEFGDLQEMA